MSPRIEGSRFWNQVARPERPGLASHWCVSARGAARWVANRRAGAWRQVLSQVTGGRVPSRCWGTLDQGRSFSQEGPAEEGGASHPRSTVTMGHVGSSLAAPGSAAVLLGLVCCGGSTAAAEPWVGSPDSSLPQPSRGSEPRTLRCRQTTSLPRRAGVTIAPGASLGAQASLGRRRPSRRAEPQART